MSLPAFSSRVAPAGIRCRQIYDARSCWLALSGMLSQRIYKRADFEDIDFSKHGCIDGIESSLFLVTVQSAPGLFTSPVLGILLIMHR